jgi:hypothetical protein
MEQVMKHKNLTKIDIAMVLELLSEGCTLTEISHYVYSGCYYYLRDQLIRHGVWDARPRPNNSKRLDKKEFEEKRAIFIQSLN